MWYHYTMCPAPLSALEVFMLRLPVFLHAAQHKRHRGDSNPCGQRTMDFESISLAARAQCHGNSRGGCTRNDSKRIPRTTAQQEYCAATKLVPRGLEPRTLRLLAVRSNQLSYETRCICHCRMLAACSVQNFRALGSASSTAAVRARALYMSQ